MLEDQHMPEVNENYIPFNVPSLIYCPYCQNIPQLKLNSDYSITVKCSFRNHDLYEKNITLAEYNEALKTPGIHILYCQNNLHDSPVLAKTFCTVCKKLYCSNCAGYHDFLYDGNYHMRMPAVASDIITTCDEMDCNNFRSYYCLNCKLYVCGSCLRHHHNHNYILLSHFSFVDMDKYVHDANILSHHMLEEYNILFHDIEALKANNYEREKINEWNTFLKDTLRKDALILRFLRTIILFSFIDDYNQHFNSWANVLLNNIGDIEQKRRNILEEKYNSYFGITLKENNTLPKMINSIKEEDFILNDLNSVNVPNFHSNPINLRKGNILTDLRHESLKFFVAYNDNGYINHIAFVNRFSLSDICIYDLDDASVTKILKFHSANVTLLKYYYQSFNESHLLLSASLDQTIKVYDIVDEYKNIFSLFINNDEFSDLLDAFLLFRDSIFSVGYTFPDSHNIYIYDLLQDNKEDISDYMTINNYTEPFYYGNEIFLIMLGSPGISVFNYSKMDITHQLFAQDDNLFTTHDNALIFSNCNSLSILDSDNTGVLRIWDFISGNLITTIQQDYQQVSFHDRFSLTVWNNEFLLVGGYDGRLRYYDMTDFNLVRDINIDNHPIFSMKKIRDINRQERLIICSDHGKLYEMS